MTARDPRTDPRAGDVLRMRGSTVTVMRRERSHVNYTIGGFGLRDRLKGWRTDAADAEVVHIEEPPAGGVGKGEERWAIRQDHG
jgi:hypothetical protein